MSRTPEGLRHCPEHPDTPLQPNELLGLQPWCPKGHYLGAPAVGREQPLDQVDNMLAQAEPPHITGVEVSEG